MTTEAIVLHQKWQSLPLLRFPRECWRPSALRAFTLTHRRPPPPPPDSQGAFTCLPLNSMPTRQEWMKGVWEHGKLDNPVSGKFVRTKRLSVTCVMSHGNSILFSGVMICYCFITPSGGGRPPGVCANRRLSSDKSTWRLRLHCSDLVLKSVSLLNTLR